MVHLGQNIKIPWKISTYRPFSINTFPSIASNSEKRALHF